MLYAYDRFPPGLDNIAWAIPPAIDIIPRSPLPNPTKNNATL